MAYIATIQNKTISNGTLRVTVTFSNSELNDSFNFDFTTNQDQSETWLEEQIQNKLKHLNALPVVADTITVGTTITETTNPTAPTNTAYEQYKANLKTFQQMVNAIQKGIITKDNPDFIALKAQLADDFNIAYIDLF